MLSGGVEDILSVCYDLTRLSIQISQPDMLLEGSLVVRPSKAPRCRNMLLVAISTVKLVEVVIYR